eukprot:PhM_4_TR12442/c0_g2_i1/m.83258/K14674/TGL4; TAG lipase / steryl ester hydrolase / phospholipase A2 / LPA acyltransferase
MSHIKYVIRAMASYLLTLLLDFIIVHPLSFLQSVFRAYVSRAHRRRHEARYRSILKSTDCHETWFNAAARLDKLHGYEEWRANGDDFPSQEQLQKRLHHIRRLRQQGNARALAQHIRSELHRNELGICDPRLYGYHTGTKNVVEEYVWEVVGAIEDLAGPDKPDALVTKKETKAKSANPSPCASPAGSIAGYEYSAALLRYGARADASDDPRISSKEKYEILKDTAQSYGRSALMLSGGAALGLYHTGVVKALYECGVMPRIISGSSAGAIIAAIFGTRTDDEIAKLLREDLLQHISLDAFEKTDTTFDSVKVKLWRLITRGAFMDVTVLAQMLRFNCQDMTFLEAYHRTGRVLNVSVAAVDREADGLVLNYITAPDVVIWSAVCASCALKGLFDSVQLMVKDSNQNIMPYLEGQLWSDGSVPHDIPTKRLSQLFNVSFYIVSQTNPHVIPFVSPPPSFHVYHKEGATILDATWFRVCREANHWLQRIYDVGLLPDRAPFNFPRLLTSQHYQGHITILPIGNVLRAVPDFVNLVANPSVEHMDYVISTGQRRTWPHVNHIRWTTAIERALDHALNTLNTRHLKKIHRAPVTKMSSQGQVSLQLVSSRRHLMPLASPSMSSVGPETAAARLCTMPAADGYHHASNVSASHTVLPASGRPCDDDVVQATNSSKVVGLTPIVTSGEEEEDVDSAEWHAVVEQ